VWVKGEIFRNLDEAEGSARGELDRDAQISLFDRIDWFRRTWRYVAPEGKPLILRARAEGSDCWLFLVQDGNGADAMTSWYTLAFRPIFTGEPTDVVKSALLIAIARRLKKQVSAISLAPMPEADADLVTRTFDRARWVTLKRETTVNWTVATEGLTFEEYWAARPGELRSTVKRKQGKFDVKTTIHTKFNSSAWFIYEAIYEASWKPEEGSMPFLRDMAEAEGKAGALRMGVATIDDAPVAAQLWTVENGRAIIHKLAHLETASAQSPGSILTAAMFEHVIDQDKVSLVDFGTGDDRYKADWMDRRDPLYSVSLYDPMRPAGIVGAIKAWVSSLVGRGGNR
jgi:Acetyltransferase (GNAT) domain